jgi:hypothetical protein
MARTIWSTVVPARTSFRRLSLGLACSSSDDNEPILHRRFRALMTKSSA